MKHQERRKAALQEPTPMLKTFNPLCRQHIVGKAYINETSSVIEVIVIEVVGRSGKSRRDRATLYRRRVIDKGLLELIFKKKSLLFIATNNLSSRYVPSILTTCGLIYQLI